MTTQQKSPSNKKKTLIASVIGFLVLVMAVLYTRQGIIAKKQRPKAEAPPVQKLVVETLPLVSDSYVSQVIGFGVAKPRYALTLRSEVAGRVDYTHNAFAVGKRVQKKQALVQLDQSDMKQAIASQQAVLANAELNLLEEQRKRTQARYEWEASGLSGTPDSPLYYREPQIKAVKATIANATLALQQRKKDLAYSTIRAPFDAVIAQTSVQPGALVSAGTAVATLHSTDRVEVTLPLTAKQWAQLPSSRTLHAGKWPVILETDDASQRWRGYVARVGKSIDQKTRQRSLIVAVERPYDRANPLYVGTFLKVRIDGKVMPNLWKVPITAVSQAGDVWLLDEKSCLVRLPVSDSFSRDDMLYLNIPENYQRKSVKTNDFQVVVTPLNTFVAGMCVTAKPRVTTSSATASRAKQQAHSHAQSDLASHTN